MGSYNCCTPSEDRSKQVIAISVLLKMIAEESRLKLLCVLRDGEHCVCEIVKHVKLSQSLISHHLKSLKDMGLVVNKKRGVYVYYRLTEKGKEIIDLLFQIKQ